MEADNVARLAQGLAAVAIATLVGNPVAAVAATAAVPFLTDVLKRHARTNSELTQVVDAITAWAEGDNLGDGLAVGLEIATETMRRHGLNANDFKELDYNADRGTFEIIRRARRTDPESWAVNDNANEDAGHVVARRAIRATLAGVVSSRHGIEATLLAALREEFRDAYLERVRLAAAVDVVQGTVEDVQEFVQQSNAPGTVADAMAYLRSRIADWDVQVWPTSQQAPSALERDLRVVDAGSKPTRGSDALTTEEALAGQEMLVVLGGPGSGKSWLARRYARQAAQTALGLLEDGASLDAVELPLLTTWDQWSKTPGSLRQSLLDASFASGSGHSDVGTADDVRRLQRAFTRPGAGVLLVVDSLDEAADLSQQADRLHELRSLPGWRAVVTSRPAAWYATYRGPVGRDAGPLVVQVQDLAYPADVEAFVRAWFTGDPHRAEALVSQIEARDDIRGAAVVPLILTFYCLLVEKSTQPGWQLPARRRELYQSLVRRLLLGKWSVRAPGADAGPDIQHCEGLLAEWAWEAVRDGTTADGLGDWGDTFLEPSRPKEHDRRPIDHVAPKVSEDDEGRVSRRFVHRTILEHFVAEHMATLGSAEAADILLPHLWFDPDWEVAAPAGIAAHNRKQRGELLEAILQQAGCPGDQARQAAASEFDLILLGLAQESEPHEWTPQHQGIIDDCRVRNSTHRPQAVTSTSHWTNSNGAAFEGVVAALPTAEPTDLRELVGELSALNPTDGERAAGRGRLLAALSSAGARHVRGMMVALSALGPTDAERAEARVSVLAALRAAAPLDVSDLATALPAVVVTDVERAEARAGVFAVLRVADWRAVSGLAATLCALDPSNAERTEAHSLVLAALASAGGDAVSELVAALSALAPTEDERANARAAVWTALRAAGPWNVSDLVAALSTLDPSEEERVEARLVVLVALSSADPWAVIDLVGALSALEPTDQECAEARSAVLAALPSADSLAVNDLIGALSALGPTDAERDEARSAVLAALSTAGPFDVGNLMTALPALVTTEEERAEARIEVMTALPTADTHTFWEVMATVSVLDPSDEERAEARDRVLAALSSEDLARVGGLVMSLRALVATDVERADARVGLLAAMSTVDPRAIRDLVSALFSLGPTNEERAEARMKVLAALSSVDPNDLRGLVRALYALNPSDEERAEARTRILAALPSVDSWAVGGLVSALRFFSSSQSWLAWLTNEEEAS